MTNANGTYFCESFVALNTIEKKNLYNMPKQPPFDVVNSFKTTLFKFTLKCKPFMFTMVLLEECNIKVQLLSFKDKT